MNLNLVSFVDELVKLGAMRCMRKHADVGSEIPAGMMDGGAAPPSIRVVPDEASTRATGGELPNAIGSGALGGVTTARHPIDRERFNRPYVERR